MGVASFMVRHITNTKNELEEAYLFSRVPNKAAACTHNTRMHVRMNVFLLALSSRGRPARARHIQFTWSHERGSR